MLGDFTSLHNVFLDIVQRKLRRELCSAAWKNNVVEHEVLLAMCPMSNVNSTVRAGIVLGYINYCMEFYKHYLYPKSFKTTEQLGSGPTAAMSKS